MEPKIVGSRIKVLMEKRNITLQQLAEAMNIEKTNLEKKLEGEEEFVIDEMGKIAEIFNLSVKECDELFFK